LQQSLTINNTEDGGGSSAAIALVLSPYADNRYCISLFTHLTTYFILDQLRFLENIHAIPVVEFSSDSLYSVKEVMPA
jgi:hypothetical protein